ncbi:uncharacterized protein MONBRDRAFT_8057 [Monosiga brevicollis MX1]|uniref:Gamma-glutamylcyclotransferase AIG2-like domain-containing protein n=1 Tax=Monosiga brevicollis TaxID=81824 RepID=A9UYX4_MONBE|nr:uncharacterized protein MONBRDRAFT_8057 [Monosiga brevicollis MX1]EDQ89536.1 predicted protein [Monosiga brevicollis MX1]|eukprot:XP_001745565.1 hypothetical protein [Monosiga brevicollis MX1]
MASRTLAAAVASAKTAMPVHYVFSYGSNGMKQLQARVHAAVPLPSWPAYVANYTRIFCLRSLNWGGSVASIYPAPDHRVMGSLTALTPEQLERLDVFEAGYTREPVMATISDQSGEEHHVAASVYVATNPEWRGPPSPAYLTAIAKTLREQHPDFDGRLPIWGLVEAKLREVDVYVHPSSHKALELPAFLYELGTSLKHPWIMPTSLTPLMDALAAGGCSSMADLQAMGSTGRAAMLRSVFAHAVAKGKHAPLEETVEEAIQLVDAWLADATKPAN